MTIDDERHGTTKHVVRPCDNEDGRRTWSCVRCGDYYADFDRREDAQKYCDENNRLEADLWDMTPRERAAILEDRGHELWWLACILNKHFNTFRAFRTARSKK